MQPGEVIPADGFSDRFDGTAFSHETSEGLAIVGKSCFEIPDGENLGRARHWNEDQDLLTFGENLVFRLLFGLPLP